MQLLRNERGFTLIEMVVVIILLGLLSSTAIPYYLNMQKEAKIASTKGNLAAIRGGLELAHAKILVSGVNTGPDGDNPDWPTLEEMRRNALVLSTRPEPLRNLRLVRTNDFSLEADKALPAVNLPEMTTGMSSRPAGVADRSLQEATNTSRIASESTGWAYYPGDERDENGQTIDAIFYINDDRTFTDNVDGSGRTPANF